MCERVFQTLDIVQLVRVTGTSIIKNSDRYEQSYNINPQNYLPVIRYASSTENNNRQLDMLKWGYNTRFQQIIINARAEEIHLKKTFKPLVNSRRCCVIIEGYYEWNARKEPFVFMQEKKDLPEDEVPNHLLVAAVCTPDESLIILTREATGTFNGVHDRMPVLLEHDELDMWINCGKYKYEDILKTKLLSEEKEIFKSMFYYQVAPYVNDLKKKNSLVLTSFEEYRKEIKTERAFSAFTTPLATPKKNKILKDQDTIKCKTEAERTLWPRLLQKTEEKLNGKESKIGYIKEEMKDSRNNSKEFIKIDRNLFKTLNISRKEKDDPVKVQIKNEFINTTSKKDLKKAFRRSESDIESIEDPFEKSDSKRGGKGEKENLAIVLTSPHKNLENIELDIERGYEIKKVVVFVKKEEKDVKIPTKPEGMGIFELEGKPENERSKKRKDYEEKNLTLVPDLKKMKRNSLNPFLFKKEET